VKTPSVEAMVPVIEAALGRGLPGDWVMRLTERLVTVLGVESVPIAGAIGALKGVTGLGLPWRVASNSSHQEMGAKFSCIGIADLVVGRVHSYTDVAHGKPAPDLFLAAAAAEGIGPAGCVVIEDSATGARAAAAAGMLCLGYAPRGDGAQLRSEGAYVFSDMGELPALLAVTRR
jgi:beta-phosphoglucomutase-like phosphatase (HAD superfamily)